MDSMVKPAANSAMKHCLLVSVSAQHSCRPPLELVALERSLIFVLMYAWFHSRMEELRGFPAMESQISEKELETIKFS